MPVLLKTAIRLLVLAGAFLIAVSDDVYGMTLPAALPHHLLFRKLYALLAFSVAGAVIAPVFAPKHRTIKTVIAVAALSALIETAQHFLGSDEGRRWIVFDIASGGVGGFIGALAAERFRK